jgi:hypothetical protein
MRKNLGIALTLFLIQAVHVQASQPSTAFDQHGVIIDVRTFFKSTDQARTPEEIAHGDIANRALATTVGVYSFLETPENQSQLAQMVPGTVVRIQGQLLEKGALVHIDTVTKASQISLDLDLAGLRNNAGQKVSLKGANKCQCGLAVEDLPHSCLLGHLHHLEAEDGKIYHYLPFAQGQDIFLGKDSHFKAVEVEGRVFPGQFLLLDAVKIAQN